MQTFNNNPISDLAVSLSADLRNAFRRVPARDVAAGVAELDLLAWGRRFLPAYFAQPASKMHRWLAGRLATFEQTRGQKLNVIGPRGSAKSTVGTLAMVLRAAVEGSEPYIWIVSDTKQQAQTHLENLKTELSENRLLAEAYPAAVGRGGWWRSTGIELAGGVVIEAFGTGQRIRGRRRRSHRPTLIVCDDLQNDSHIGSARRREGTREWFHGTLLRAGTPRTNVVNLATALHRDALAMQLDRTPGWESRLFRAVERWPDEQALWREWETLYCDVRSPNAGERARRFYETNRLIMETGSELLWPEVDDLYSLMRMRVESGVTAFEREKQSSPIDPERCEWPESYFGEHVWFDQWPKDLTLRTLALDPSKGSDARQGDYSAIVMLGIDAEGILHVQADLARRPTPQMVADGVDCYLQFRPEVFGVEANQWQQLLAAEFVAEFQRRGLLGVTPCELTNYTNKAVRIRRLGPYLSQRRVRFKRGCASTELLVDQLRDFPIAQHDDGPDALEMALRLAEEVWQGGRASDGLGDRLRVG